MLGVFRKKSGGDGPPDLPRRNAQAWRSSLTRRPLPPLTAVLALLVLIPAPAWTQPGKNASVRDRIQAFVDQGEIPGAVVVVGRKNAILAQEAIGRLRPGQDDPMPQNALFRIASMTKPITALGIMMLVEEGKLSVEDPVEKFLPEFRGQMLVAQRSTDTLTLKKPFRPIRVRDLLTHTSGMGSYPPGLSNLYMTRRHTLAEAVLALSQRPLEFEPGSRWSYCSAGFDTLGRLIEVLSGQRYEDFMKKRIFDPLEMKDTTFYPTPEQQRRVPPLYHRLLRKAVEFPTGAAGPATRFPIPAGGLYSTGADLARLYQMLLNRGSLGRSRLLSPESVSVMTRVQIGDLEAGFTPGMGYGFGWGVVRRPQGVTRMLSPGAFGHGGAFGTQGWIDPQQDLFVILLIQRLGLQNPDASPMREAVQEAAVGLVKR